MLLKLANIYETSIDNIVGNDSDATFNITKIERYLKEIENCCDTLRREMYEFE